MKNDKLKIGVDINYLPCVNYSMMNSGIQTCSGLVIRNNDERDWHDIAVSVSGQYIKEACARIDQLRQGQSIQVNDLVIQPDIKLLSETTEAVNTTFVLRVEEAGQLLSEEEMPITLLAYDEWAGAGVLPEHLAAFVVPNNPMLARVTLKAADYLEQWTGSSAFDEYQTQDRNRVRAQVAALYEALRNEGIIYSSAPASFEETGQRIRLADKVLTEKIGNCIDITLLVASCLESVGIQPIILLLKGHAMVGAWLMPKVFPQMVCDDASYLLKETADGMHNLVLLESTLITSSAPVGFEDAVKAAMKSLTDEKEFLFFIDIHRCRLAHIRPMPQRIMKDGAWSFETEGLEHQQGTEKVKVLNHFDLRLEESNTPMTKQTLWERKLLDFSLRNNLLNMRLGRKVVPFISFEISNLEDHIQQSEDYHIIPAPGKKIEPNEDGLYDSSQQATEYHTYIAELINDHKIASYLTETELLTTLKYVHRTARTSLEENGANSLFLTLGMLKWYETDKSQQPRYAPLLLLPVDIVRKSSNNYVIRKRDEDIILNITLVELLKQNFDINLDCLQVLPKDGCGVDVKLIFTYFRQAIISQKRWNVIEESMLGLFSFNKFVMWNDIHSNADKLKENVIVASLIDGCDHQGSAEETVDARSIDKENSPMDFSIPLDVDSSQMEAIVESGRGRSFILHGPPGTGKSQTITNMIANALYQGKRILFVAEKMAALSVVQSRLQKIGLAPYCLELHSNKATKKHFLEQMDQVLKITKTKSPAAFARKSDELFQERKALISYMEALHKKGSSGLSLYECISRYLSLTEEEISEGLPACSSITTSFIDQCKGLVPELHAVLAIIGTPCQHPLYRLEPADNRQASIEQLFSLLRTFQQGYASKRTMDSNLWAAISVQPTTDAPEGVKETDNMEWLRLFVKREALVREHNSLRDTLTASYHEDILKLNVKAFQQEWDEIKSKWFLPRFFAKKKFLQSFSRYGNVFESGVDDLLHQIDVFQLQQKELDMQEDSLIAFGCNHSFSHGARQQAFDNLPRANQQEFVHKAKTIINSYAQLCNIVAELNTLTSLPIDYTLLTQKTDLWLSHETMMKDWYLWVDQKQTLLTMGLQPVVSQLEEGRSPLLVMNGYLKGIYHLLIQTTIDSNAQLRMFNGLKFRQQIEKYKHDTKIFQELSKQELLCKLASRIPSAKAENSEISFLKRNIANGGRGNSIRTILDGIPTLLPTLCPCMLMSPISVAQYLDLSADKFDLVIFDEASQMPTSEAVGAIARGKALVVVGDSKQMPPTSFFATTQVDEDEADIDDMESILDDCITLSLSEHQLNWHYRSKHESLIAFSNSQYYGNNLLTFPSIDDHVAKVRLVQVDGVYDKGHTRSNPEESKVIVNEIIRRLSDPELRRYSIGVVSFSKVQGDRIEDDLLEALDKHPDLKDAAYNCPEPIFVKNLENVQGDERDIILFSVGYGADKDGKVSMNFGPLNNNGGERRLNVAVSRARYEMIVFSTLRANQIDLKRSQARGVEGLKGFLEFAETGILPLQSSTTHTPETNVMVNQICTALEAQGYLTERAVGRSNFKVDIAIAEPEHPDAYILGILCDGRNYYETKTTRDREIVQPSVLKMLNWHIMRVYSIDWYENRERALAQILAELKNPTPENDNFVELEELDLQDVEEEAGSPTIPQPSEMQLAPQAATDEQAWPAAPIVPADYPIVPPKESTTPKVSKFCTYCGKALQPEAKFCNACGRRVAP